MSSLKQKAIKGFTWSFFERIGIQFVKFILSVILARLLTPKDFGLIGMITVFFAIAQVFIDGGFGLAYVQKKEISKQDANTVFYSNLGISLILYIILWFSAPLIANFYVQPSLVELTRVMGFVLIINAFNIVHIAQITRAVNFKLKTKITLTATTLAGTIGIISAYNGLGVWSLVIQTLLNRLFTTIGLLFTSTWKPSLQFSSSSFKSMFSFGSWILLAGILRTIFDNIYILTIGKLFPIAQLGFYTKAKQFQKLAISQISGAVSSVAFPVFSEMQDEKIKLRNAMNRFLTHTLFFTLPILVILIVVAKPFIILLLTEKWAPMIPFLQWLSVVGLFYPIHQVNIQILLAQGKSNLNLRLNLLKNGLRILNLIIMYRFGIIYIIYGEIALSIIALIINTWYTGKLIDYGFIKQTKDIWKIFFSAFIAGLIGIGLNTFIDNLWGLFIVGTFTTGIAFIGIQYLINRNLLIEILRLIKHTIGK